MPIWALYAGGVLLLTVVGFGTGWQVREWKADSDELASVQAGIKRGKELQELADYKAGRYEEQRDEAQVAIRDRETQIRTIYRTNEIVVPAECEPPADALSVLDFGIFDANTQITGQFGSTVPSDSKEAGTIR
jgi:hypothetical protein